MTHFIYLTIASLFITITSQAQSFRLEAPVEAVQQSGYHRIQLPPDVVGQLNMGLTDIRLYDHQKHEIPYVLIREQPGRIAQFIDYEVVSRNALPHVATTVILRNRAKNRINSLGLLIKNTNVGKKARLSGSSDAQNWYAIDDNLWLEPTQTNASTTETKRLDFPLSDYEYYRLDINDSLSTPLNILRIGYYLTAAKAGDFSLIPDVTISQRDSSDKQTYIHLSRTRNARFDKLSIRFKASAPFRRQAAVGQFRTRKKKRGRLEQWFDIVRTVELSSADSSVIYLPGLKAKDLYVIITNDDNQPLVVSDVRAYQYATFLLANLTADSAYLLRFGAKNSAAPAYDLAYFKNNLPANSPIVQVGIVRSISSSKTETTSLFSDRRIIWPALGLVLVMLGILSYRMLREMGKSNPKPDL
ncbi:hypothetical protein G8759_08575 [Spirosoma aureum]|uniref:DUF3999 domain-containing protein n=1 Tax=Spirosoma aureum TaxID=2692134 RepID=A0A6G9AK06_9BACT|nr:hypothetical protein [Spirosoma aureum]QIP12674.1 hypothetical protein G8759_08575 [Spirosoma aureum]